MQSLIAASHGSNLQVHVPQAGATHGAICPSMHMRVHGRKGHDTGHAAGASALSARAAAGSTSHSKSMQSAAQVKLLKLAADVSANS